MIGLGLIELFVVAVFVVGVFIIVKDDSLTMIHQILWIIAVLFFNVLGLLAYFIWRSLSKQRVS